MSMRFASLTQPVTTADYVVVAPQMADILSGTLRSAYAAELTAYEHFSDLLYQLDRIEAVQSTS